MSNCSEKSPQYEICYLGREPVWIPKSPSLNKLSPEQNETKSFLSVEEKLNLSLDQILAHQGISDERENSISLPVKPSEKN